MSIMKKSWNEIGKLNRMIAWMCVVVMIFDTQLLWSVAENNEKDTVSYEMGQYEMDKYMADGSFDGDKSDKFHKDKTGPVGDGEYRMMFNILEIVPSENKGVIGYTIGGCEPVLLDKIFGESTVTSIIENKVLTEAQLREAVIDAMMNVAPGSDNGYDHGNGKPRDEFNGNEVNKFESGAYKWLKEFNAQMNPQPFDYRSATCTGYYKYVGDGNGVYSIAYKKGTSDEDRRGLDNVVMVSRFYNHSTDNQIPESTGKNDYVWVETATLLTSEGPNDKNIYVENHKRVRYVNNENFLHNMMGATNKDDYIFSVNTKTPVSVSIDDIENADLIMIANNNTGIYQNIAKFYNKMNGVGENTDILTTFSSTNDMTFDKVLKIYDRVAVREDVAIVAEKNCVQGVTFDTGVRKLMCMLFYVKKKGDVRGSGRRMFQDYLKCYVEDMPAETLKLRTDERYFDKDDSGNLIGNYSRYMPRSLTLNKSTDLINGYMHDVHPYEQRNDAIMGSYYEYYVDANGNRRAKLKKITLNTIDDLNMDTQHNDGDLLGKWYKNGNLVDVTYGEVRNYIGIPKRPPEFRSDSMYSHKTDNWFKNILHYPLISKEEFDNSNILGYYVDDKNEYTSTYPGGINWDYKYFLNVYASKSNTTDYVYIDEETGDFVRPSGDDSYSGKWYSMNNNGNNGGKYFLKTIEWDSIGPISTWPWNPDTQQHDQGDKGCLKEWFLCADGTRNYWDYDQNRYEKSDMHLMFEYYYYDFCNSYRALKDLDGASAPYKNQILVQENEEYKNNNSYIKNAIQNRSYKREENEEERRVEKDGVQSLLSVNVTNGDGVNNQSSNKVLYINEYEKPNTPDLPIKFKIRTSANIDNIKLVKNGTTIVTYKKAASNDVKDETKPDLTFTSSSSGGRSSSITVKNITDGVERVPGTDDQYVYVLEGTIPKAILESDLNDVKTEFEVVATLKRKDTSTKTLVDSDTISVVIRDFFKLN